jgi:hypothetical protein
MKKDLDPKHQLIMDFIDADVRGLDESFKATENFSILEENKDIRIHTHLTKEVRENNTLKDKLEKTIQYVLKKDTTLVRLEEELKRINLQNSKK